jgi:hypothetical protein
VLPLHAYLMIERLDSEPFAHRISHFSLLKTSLAVVAVACLCGVGFLQYQFGGRHELLSLPSLSKEAEGIRNLVLA